MSFTAACGANTLVLCCGADLLPELLRKRASLTEEKTFKIVGEIRIQHILSATLSRQRVTESTRKYSPCGNTAGSSHR